MSINVLKILAVTWYVHYNYATVIIDIQLHNGNGPPFRRSATPKVLSTIPIGGRKSIGKAVSPYTQG